MIVRVIQTIFLVVGLVMVWLAFLYNFEANNLAVQEEPVVQESKFEIYTLANTTFEEEEPFETVALNKFQEPDMLVATGEEQFVKDPMSFELDEEAAEQEEETILTAAKAPADFSYILAGSGLLLLVCGIASLKISGN
jgi:hypothetical protein